MEETLENLFDDDDLGLEEFGSDNEDDTIEKPAEELSTENLFEDDTETPEGEKEESIVDSLLKAKGIVDGKVKFIDENNETQEVNFYDLTREEQLDILNNEEETPTPASAQQFTGDTEELVQYLKDNNLTVDQFLEGYKQSIENSIAEKDSINYEIDAYDDQELYLLDLKNKFDLTDEELVQELEKELQNEDLFKRKVDKLREEYKNLEDQYKESQKVEFEQKQQEQYDQFSQQMVDVAINTPEFYGIELEDDEKNEVLSFLLDLDDNGSTEFYKALNDPAKLYEAAWFLRYGKESFDMLKNAYESEIAKLKKPDKPAAVVRKTEPAKKEKSINDLF